MRGGQLLQSTCRFEQLLAVDVRVARDRREVGVSQVLDDEARVAQLLAEPGRGGVPQRVRGDVFLDPGALRGASPYQRLWKAELAGQGSIDPP